MESDSKVIDHSNTLLEIGGKVTEKRKKKTNWRGRGGYRGRGGSCSQGLINNNTDVNVLELSEKKLQQSSQKIQLGNENNVNEVAEANESSENVSNKIEKRKKSQWRGWYRRGRGAYRGRGRSNSEEFINNDNITFNSLDPSGNENILQCWSSQEIQSSNENKVNENAENVENNFSGRPGRRGWRNGNMGRQRWGKIQSNECEIDANCQEVNSQQKKKWPNRGRGGFRGRGKSNISQTDNIQTEYNTPSKIDDDQDWAKGQWRDQVGENFRNGNRDKENENNFSSMIGKYMKRDTSYTKVSDILECEADHYSHENQNKICLLFENTNNTTDVLKNSVESQNVFNANEELCLPKSKRNRRRRKNHKKLNKTDSVNLGLPTENLKEKDTENEIKAQASCIKSTGTHHIPDISFNQWVSQNQVEIAEGGMPASHFPVATQSSVTREVGSSQYHDGVEKKTRYSLQDLFSQASLLTNQSPTSDQASLLASKSLNSDDPLASFDTVSPGTANSHKVIVKHSKSPAMKPTNDKQQNKDFSTVDSKSNSSMSPIVSSTSGPTKITAKPNASMPARHTTLNKTSSIDSSNPKLNNCNTSEIVHAPAAKNTSALSVNSSLSQRFTSKGHKSTSDIRHSEDLNAHASEANSSMSTPFSSPGTFMTSASKTKLSVNTALSVNSENSSAASTETPKTLSPVRPAVSSSKDLNDVNLSIGIQKKVSSVLTQVTQSDSTLQPSSKSSTSFYDPFTAANSSQKVADTGDVLKMSPVVFKSQSATVIPAVSHKKQHMSSISSTTSFQDKSSINPKNSSLNHLLCKSSSQPIPVKTSQTFQKAKYKLSPADSGPCNKLDFFLSPYCKLVIKSYGDIAKEKSELLVSVLGPEVDMRRTKVGQSFNREFPFHMEELHYCRKSNPNSKVLTIQNPIGSNCKAICHAVLTPWDKDNSQGQFETALDNIFDVVHQLNIKSISIPPLGYGQAFKFPADYMVKWLLNYIVKLRIKNDLQKIIIVAPDPKLFYEFRQQGPSHFGFAVKVRLEHKLIHIDDITCDVDSCQSPKRGTVDFMKYLAQQNNIFPSHWSLNEHDEQPAVTTWGSSMINMFSNIFGVSKKTPVKAKQVDVDSETHAAIQKLIHEILDTSVIGHGADATNMYYSSIIVTSIKRIENPVLFEKYHNRRKELLEKMIKKGLVCKDIGKITGSKGKLLTKKLLSEVMEKELYSEINEHYLFHGTKEGAITSIIENGFDPSCSNTAAMFGQGIYAAEKFTKADQYTDDKFQRSPNGTNLKLILARMLLGNVFICDENHKLVVQKVGRKFKKPPCMSCSEDLCHCVNTDHFDSLMADGKWLFREFIVYESSQIYPEYIITYQRV